MEPEMKEVLGKLEATLTEQRSAFERGNKELADNLDSRIESLENQLAETRSAMSRAEAAADEVVQSAAIDFRSALTGHNSEITVRATEMSTLDPDSAGNLIDNSLVGRITAKAQLAGGIYANASKQTVGGNLYQVPYQLTDIEVESVTELQARAKTDVSEFGQIDIKLFLAHATPAISVEMLEDSAFDLENWIGNQTASAIARYQANLHVNGNGTTQQGGVLSALTVGGSRFDASKVATVAFSTGAAADWKQLAGLEADMHSEFLSGSKWYMSRATFNAYRTIEDTTGAPKIIETYKEGLGVTRSWMGYDIVFDDYLPAYGTDGCVLFGDMAEGFTIVEKRAVTVLRDEYTVRPLVGFYTTARQGSGVTNGQALRAMSFA